MFNIPLPPRPNLDHYKKRAKELVAVAASKDPDALRAFAADWIRALAKLIGQPLDDPTSRLALAELVNQIAEALHKEQERAGGKLALANAQFVIANLHGYANWMVFSDELHERTRADAPPFERAVDAIVTGDLDSLKSLLSQNPGLVRERSRRAHRCALLHYVAANGVEDYRQKTPANAVDIARVLLDAGAEVDALAETYGGGNGQTTMNLLVSSAHPDIAGLQGALAELLLDYGARIEGLGDDGAPLQTALAFGYIRTAETLVRRGARIGNITAAAALGRLDLVQQFVEGTLPEPKESLLKLYWSGVPRDRFQRQRVALHWACANGRTDVVKYFLDLGMDPADTDDNKMSALHNACSGAHMDVVHMLLARNVPLEAKNTWGGTVLNSTLYFANEARRRRPKQIPRFAECVEALIVAGADVSVVDYVTEIPEIDAVLDRHRPRPAS